MQISVQSAKQNLGIEPAPHLHSPMSTEKIMVIVLLSLIPALGVMTFFFGSGTIIQFFISAATALLCQVLAAVLRSRSIKRSLKDPSGLVTAILLALTLPQLLPWYYTVMATAFAMLLVRECFGGLGQNLFNPAMSGFIFLIISSPGVFYTTWVTPTPYAITVATPDRAWDVIMNGADPQILVREIKELNRSNEIEAAHNELMKAQELARAHDAAADAAGAAADAAAAADPAGAEGTAVSDEAAATADTIAAEADAAAAQATGEDAAEPDAAAAADTAAGADGSQEADSAEAELAEAAARDRAEDHASFEDMMATATLSKDHLTTDALTGATYLESIKTARKAGDVKEQPPVDLYSPSFVAYAWLAGAYVLGGMVLIFTKVIRFQPPLAFIIAIGAMSYIWNYYDPQLCISMAEHLIMGGTMLGAFYIITDPVTTCGTFKGRILLSVIIGMLIVLIRVHGSYSDSVAFAVMLGNCLAPLMDVMTRRRPFGVGYRPGGLN
ncbi:MULTISPECIES: RnfABCDGE type electron transport complex subunit D [unclassified Anaerobiospirillum]|uniref:RnfABCDGE type electron transport complex subunit D n=1 Tax=unclassified Anaerobiospirillum TaxID=2647410 RepID=UPI001FF63A0E|nr:MULTISPECIES: RnfABCDGE type electron transport complex subunit D [unclassified Anaerobiospirillum]MCK0535048.1 RnfABCDGE type electron transport complex subunit D [Anaerobiospirillum sp. NML120511]MCK0540173.1 RnfABCDGE type electron transport complex subunit D [Anaerobiospirillum sp. NML02-A-032]